MGYIVLMPAAGSGSRMAAGHNKLFLPLGGEPILLHTLRAFERDPACEEIILAVKESERIYIQEMLTVGAIGKVKRLPTGGESRQESVFACLREARGSEFALVHDAARPFIRRHVIVELLEAASVSGAAIAAVPMKDTVKRVEGGIVQQTLDRGALWMIQTPQAFRLEILRQAHERARADAFEGTDESVLVERLGLPVAIVSSTYDNIKMTTPEDLVIGEAILAKREREGAD